MFRISNLSPLISASAGINCLASTTLSPVAADPILSIFALSLAVMDAPHTDPDAIVPSKAGPTTSAETVRVPSSRACELHVDSLPLIALKPSVALFAPRGPPVQILCDRLAPRKEEFACIDKAYLERDK